MAANLEWQLVYFDDYGVIFVKKSYSEEKDQLKISFEKLREMGITEIQKANEPDVLGRLANLYQLMGLRDLINMTLLKMERIQQI